MRKKLANMLLVIVSLAAVTGTIGCSSNNGVTTSSQPIATSNPAMSVPTTSVPSTSTSTPTTGPTTPALSNYTVNVVSKTGPGNYLVDSRGFTLYYTTSDKPNFSNLPDETLTAWPVFYAPTINVPASLNISDFGTYTRDNKVKQTTYKGFPLYFSFQDKNPGDTFGDKAGGVWFVIKP